MNHEHAITRRLDPISNRALSGLCHHSITTEAKARHRRGSPSAERISLAPRSFDANYLTINGIVVFVGSFIIMMIERRNASRNTNRSYGMLGLGISALIAIQIFAYPLIATTSLSSATTTTSSALTDNSSLQNVSQVITTSKVTAFAQLLAAQTGLTTDAITSQLQAATTTVADLLTKNSGDLDTITKAAATALDDLVGQGGMSEQIISSLGSDTSTVATQFVATQFVQGKLESRAQSALTSLLFSGAMPAMPQGAQNPPVANSTDAAAPQSQSASNGSFVAMTNTPNASMSQNTVVSAPQAQVAVPTAEPTTTVVMRPTVISFPSPTPTVVATEVSGQATSETASDTTTLSATCTLTTIYNLNLRDKPQTDSTVYLSIPYGTAVVADGHTAANWYHVTYAGQSGWVSGEYVSTDSHCDAVATVEAS